MSFISLFYYHLLLTLFLPHDWILSSTIVVEATKEANNNNNNNKFNEQQVVEDVHQEEVITLPSRRRRRRRNLERKKRTHRNRNRTLPRPTKLFKRFSEKLNVVKSKVENSVQCVRKGLRVKEVEVDDDDNNNGMKYVPGLLNQYYPDLGIRIAQGLNVRILAKSGSKVIYGNGSESERSMHSFPDHGACFHMDTPDGGFIYLSNKESRIEGEGGVGAFTFDPIGNIVNYEMILEGTTANCGGGKTPWNTFFSGEEFEDGSMWEIDPFTGVSQKTQFGTAKFESATCGSFSTNSDQQDDDDLLLKDLKCYATVDEVNGELRRFTPDPTILQEAIASNDFTKVLTTTGSSGTLDYLLLHSPQPNQFSFTSSIEEAKLNAFENYPNCEGIDFHHGKLFISCKAKKEVLVLDLKTQTFTATKTQNGDFEYEPDQIYHLMMGSDEDDDDDETSTRSDIVYFVEDGGCNPGLFVVNITTFNHDNNDEQQQQLKNKIISTKTLLEKIPMSYSKRNHLVEMEDESIGLAFCDSNKRIIVGFQGSGKGEPGYRMMNPKGVLFEITRKDGKSFHDDNDDDDSDAIAVAVAEDGEKSIIKKQMIEESLIFHLKQF